MSWLVLLKRMLFWAEASISIFIVLTAGAILIGVVAAGLISGSLGGWTQEVGAVAAYFMDPAVKITFSEPLFMLTTAFWVCVYIGTMIYFAQTVFEKRLGNYLIPLTFIGVPAFVILGLAIVLPGLGFQGAGH